MNPCRRSIQRLVSSRPSSFSANRNTTIVASSSASASACTPSPRLFSTSSVRLSQAQAQPSTASHSSTSTVAEAPHMKAKTAQLHEHGKFLLAAVPKYIQQFSVWKDELTVYTSPEALLPLMQFLRDHSACLYEQVVDITAVDYPTRANRFEVVYNLLSITYNARIRVKTYCSEVTPVPSVVPLWNGANWFEREVWDMYGIMFTGHPDLRRILTDYGFEGFPLRKDFPVTGYVEVRYDDEKKRIVAEPLELAQAFRFFDYQSPHEQTGTGVETTKMIASEKAQQPPAAEKK